MVTAFEKPIIFPVPWHHLPLGSRAELSPAGHTLAVRAYQVPRMGIHFY